MKKFGILYFISLYLFQGTFLLICNLNADLFGLMFCMGLLSLIFGVIAIIKNCTQTKNIRQDQVLQKKLNHMMLALKLLTIPFYLINFTIWVLIAMAFIVVPGVVILFPVVFIGVIIAWSVLIVTSSYSVCNLYIQFRNGSIPLGKCILHMLLQFLFVIDIFDCIYIYIKCKRELNNSRTDL